jgi:prepilin-type processing-associated H-X9-DG protein
MPQDFFHSGFTWKDIVATLAVLAIVISLSISAISHTRERARRNQCMNNMKQLGMAIQSYYDAQKHFPTSADLRGDEAKKLAGGWSFLFKILPNLEYDSIYSSIDPKDIESETVDPLTAMGTWAPLDKRIFGNNAIAISRDTGIGEFLCPSNSNYSFENPQHPIIPPGKGHAVTNYKALGATSMESLLVSVDPESPPPYGDKSQHADGVLCPAASGMKKEDIKDGLANTIMLVETIDYTASTWIAGSDVNLVGMNKAPSYFQFQDQNGSYWAPADFNGEFYGRAAPNIRALRAFTAFDFCPGYPGDNFDGSAPIPAGKDVGTYPAGVGRTPAYGPSSGHPGYVNHLFCDGSVRSIRSDVDYAAYFMAITRNGGDQGANSELE